MGALGVEGLTCSAFRNGFPNHIFSGIRAGWFEIAGMDRLCGCNTERDMRSDGYRQ